MSHRTSLYIKTELLDTIDFESKKRKITKNKLILKLLHSYAHKVPQKIKFNKSIQYQKKSENWTRVNVTMEMNEYEFLLDIRKFMKLSLSFILYLTIMEIFLKKGDEFGLNSFYDKGFYGLVLESNSLGIITWKLIWTLVEKRSEIGKDNYF